MLHELISFLWFQELEKPPFIHDTKGATMLYLGRVLLGYCTGVLSYVVSMSLLTLNMHLTFHAVLIKNIVYALFNT